MMCSLSHLSHHATVVASPLNHHSPSCLGYQPPSYPSATKPRKLPAPSYPAMAKSAAHKAAQKARAKAKAEANRREQAAQAKAKAKATANTNLPIPANTICRSRRLTQGRTRRRLTQGRTRRLTAAATAAATAATSTRNRTPTSCATCTRMSL